MRGRKCFVQVKVHNVDPEVDGSYFADNGVKVCAITVQKCANLMYGRCNFEYLIFKYSACVRIR